MTNYHTLNTFNNPFRYYRVVDIVPFQEKIAVLQFASADVSKKMVKNGVYVDHYILVDIFSEDFAKFAKRNSTLWLLNYIISSIRRISQTCPG